MASICVLAVGAQTKSSGNFRCPLLDRGRKNYFPRERLRRKPAKDSKPPPRSISVPGSGTPGGPPTTALDVIVAEKKAVSLSPVGLDQINAAAGSMPGRVPPQVAP